ncbi:hypothetical protein N431DRAFT_477136 [Stipitochalara longipes BDJ]|nr:hypothetical protein N431DRAFT_477136 [Stipitochalara longipes BDJ]
MPLHSFTEPLRHGILLFSLSLFPVFSSCSIAPSCSGDFPSVIRAEMSDNLWASNSTLAQQRGIFLWVGQQNWDTAHNNQTQPYPLLIVLSTLYNETYISTTSDGSQDLPCPNSYTYNSDWNLDTSFSQEPDYYTYTTSMTCPGFYDLSTSVPLYYQTPANFSGSPESGPITNSLASVSLKYAPSLLSLVEPEHFLNSPSSTQPMSVNGFYDNARTVYGLVPSHTNQVLGLGLNSTVLTSLFSTGWIASRSLGLYYGIPQSSNDDSSSIRNGTVILGGYSTSRLLGNFSAQTYPIGKFTLPKQCPWEVSVSSVSVGSTTIISTPFTACIEPSELSLALPAASFTGPLPPSSANYTITLSNGLVVEIPPALANTRDLTDEDMNSPILGAPFLSQVYLWADYQTRELYTGLANHSDAYLVGREEIQCVEHGSDVGNLSWAVGSSSQDGGSATSSAVGSKGTGTKSGGVRSGVNGRGGLGYDNQVISCEAVLLVT